MELSPIQFGAPRQISEDPFASERLHNSLQYGFYCTPEELRELIEQFLEKFWKIKHHVTNLLEEEHEHYDQYEDKTIEVANLVDNFDIPLILILKKLYQNEGVNSTKEKVVTNEFLTHNFTDEEEFNYPHLCDIVTEMLEDDFNVRINVNELFAEKATICIPAIFGVMQTIERCTFGVERILEFLQTEDNRNSRRQLLLSCSRLTRGFSLIICAARDDPEDIFYQKEPNADIERLCTRYEIIEPEDRIEHFLKIYQASDYIKYMYSIIPKGLGYDNKIIQGIALLSWAAFYKIFTADSLLEGELCCNCISDDKFKEAITFCQSKEMNEQLVDIPGTVEVNQLIHFSQGIEEELTLDNLNSTDSIIKEFEAAEFSTKFERELSETSSQASLDLEHIGHHMREFPFTNDDTTFDSNEHIKMRIVTAKDWGRVDWSTGNLIDKSLDPIEVDNFIIDIHGGSFNGGSSAKQFQYTKYMAMNTNSVVFSIDYRLAPLAKFPTNISDCLQGYLWVIHYAETYLQLKAKSIILEGDSAGGNLATALTQILIQKGLKVPDKLLLPYPCNSPGKKGFSPSLLLSLDGLELNFQNITPGIDLYFPAEDFDEEIPQICGNNTQKNILEKFPKTLVILLGMDGLRDESIRFASKLEKAGVDVSVVEYKDCLHGLFYQTLFPFELPAATQALDRACQFINE